jgi:hypothetical protein
LTYVIQKLRITRNWSARGIHPVATFGHIGNIGGIETFGGGLNNPPRFDSGIHARMTDLKIVASDKEYLLEIINTFTVSGVWERETRYL